MEHHCEYQDIVSFRGILNNRGVIVALVNIFWTQNYKNYSVTA